MRNRYIALLLAVAVLSITSACTKSNDVQTKPRVNTEGKPVDAAQAATIKGVVQFTGSSPKPVKVDMSADPACKGENTSEQLLAKDGRLANVFVYVKSGLPSNLVYTYLMSDAIVRQEGCRYIPHVLGVMTGQTVRFENADQAMHNIHPMPHNNQEWNTAQQPRGNPLLRKFQNQELMIPVKCNQHPWMKMYVSVVGHQFFSVSQQDGSFELKDLPPGTYTVAAVHESLGGQEQQLTIGAKETKAINFTFSGEKGAAAAK